MITPVQAETTTKANATVTRRAFIALRARNKAVAAAPEDNAIAALSTELGHNATAGNLNLLAVVAATDQVMTPVATTAVAAVPKRRRLDVAEVLPPAIVTPVRAQKKCEGCIHADLLEINLMSPRHIKHYLKPNMFLVDAGCAECHKNIRHIHDATPKASLYYCDMMIKGFNAPDDDLEKASMECGLVLCSPCREKRMLRYDKDNTTSSPRNGRTTRRRGKDK